MFCLNKVWWETLFGFIVSGSITIVSCVRDWVVCETVCISLCCSMVWFGDLTLWFAFVGMQRHGHGWSLVLSLLSCLLCALYTFCVFLCIQLLNLCRIRRSRFLFAGCVFYGTMCHYECCAQFVCFVETPGIHALKFGREARTVWEWPALWGGDGGPGARFCEVEFEVEVITPNL